MGTLLGKDQKYLNLESIKSGQGQTSLEEAKRELYEETALVNMNWLQLDSMCTLPKTIFNDHICLPKHLYVVPEYAFSVEVQGDLSLSSEHSEYHRCDAFEAQKLLKYDSNRIALWELFERLKAKG